MDQLASLPALAASRRRHFDYPVAKPAGVVESFQSGMVNPYALAYAGLDGRREQSLETFNTIIEPHAQLNSKFSEQMSKARTESV